MAWVRGEAVVVGLMMSGIVAYALEHGWVFVGIKYVECGDLRGFLGLGSDKLFASYVGVRCWMVYDTERGHTVAKILLSWAIHVGMILMNRKLNPIFITYHTASIANTLPWFDSIGGR